ncbi:MAG: large subunit ribosomal protein L22 [Candidatus Poriferisodalaceae bacterium]
MAGVIDLSEVAGAKASHQYARMSASKARAVLDLIRDQDLEKAREELQFCDRGAAHEITKVLNSAVANAEHNENLVADELYVAECWADEGPTLKRWRPRARGRATRINKQTCHIHVVVAQLADEELELRAARQAAKGETQGASRAARVAASRGDDTSADEAEEDVVVDAADAPVEDADAVAEWNEGDADSDGDENATDETPHGVDSLAPPADGSVPDGYLIKGNADSMKYHQPDGGWYDETVAEVFFATTDAAEAAGFTEAGKSSDDSDDDASTDEEG